jgi:glycosyltransferase involved in cell wall biosynthesis
MNNKNKPILTIMVPVYNEEKTIEEVLNNVFNLPLDNYEILIVDDASNDKSLKIIREIEKRQHAKNYTLTILKHPDNRGKGAVIKTALKHAKGKYFVVQDADLEYNPDDIVKLLQTALKHNYKVVYGSRFLGKIQKMPKPNYYANKSYNLLIRKLYHVDITDMHTCFKMVQTETIKGFGMHSTGFDYATELVSKILKNGIVIHEVPINYYGRTKKDGKKIGYKDGVNCIYKIIQYRFSKEI